MFSEEPLPLPFTRRGFEASASACSDGKIYCFIDAVCELSDRYERASIVHVGAGSIQVGDRLHYTVFDEPTPHPSSHNGYPGYPCQSIESCGPDEIRTVLTQDTTSPDLRVEAVVSQSVDLSFWYRLSSRRGEITISPGSFVNDYLASAILFKTKIGQGPSVVNLEDKEWKMSIVRGEGVLPSSHHANMDIFLRPHCGNRLGRCAALVTSPSQTAIITCEQDVEDFIRFLNTNDPVAKRGPWTVT